MKTAERGLVMRVLKYVVDGAFIAALVQLIAEGSKPAPPRIRALAALGFFVSGVFETGEMWAKLRTKLATKEHSTTFSLSFGFLLAFDRATPNYHHARPLWLNALAVVTLLCLIGSVGLSVYVMRKSEDERQRAMVNASLAIAFLATLTLVIVFALLQSSQIGPTLQPSYVLLTAAISWFAALYVLRRRM